MALTKKQQVFIEEYLQCWNASEAARRAGYRGRADSVGSQLLVNIGIAVEIKRRINEKTMQADEVLSRLAEQARGIPADCFGVYGGGLVGVDLIALKERGLMHLIKKINYNRDGGISSIEFYDAQSALALIGKHHALFVDRVKHEDWQSEAIELIRKGEIGYEALAEEFDDDLATRLFAAAGIPVQVGESASEDQNG